MERTAGLYVLESVGGDSRGHLMKHWHPWEVDFFNLHVRYPFRTSRYPGVRPQRKTGWRSCIKSWGNSSAMAIKTTSFLPEVGKFKLQIIILSLEPGAEPCDFHSFPSWSILLWLLVKYQGSRSVRCAEMHLHKLDAPSPGSFINSLICKESKALLIIACNCVFAVTLMSRRVYNITILLPLLCSKCG